MTRISAIGKISKKRIDGSQTCYILIWSMSELNWNASPKPFLEEKKGFIIIIK